jgi:hypothetical protein
VAWNQGRAEKNTAYAHGCFAEGICADDEDTASYRALYWAFTPGFWKNHWGNPQRPNQNDAWQYTWEWSDGDAKMPYSPYDGYMGLETSYLCNAFAAVCEYLDPLEQHVDDTTPLLDALYMRGGSDLWGAGQILLRAATASLLNASFHERWHNGIYSGSIQYFPLYSTADRCQFFEPGATDCAERNVTDLVNAALESLDRETIIRLADQLDLYNNGLHWINWDSDGPLP